MTAPAVETAVPAIAPPAPPAAHPAVAPAAAPPSPAAPAAAPATPTTTLAPTPPRIPEETDFSRDAVLARRLEALKKDPAAPPVDPDGRSPDSAPGTTTPAAETTPPAASETAAAPQYIRVPIPEGHPLREGGATYLLAENEQQARAQRATINDWTRRNQVEEYRAKIDQFERQAAEAAARQAAQDEWRASPEYATRMQQVQEVRDAFGDAVADVFAKGIDADYQRLESGKIEAALGEIDMRRKGEAAQTWISQARVRMLVLPEPVRALPQFNEWFDTAIQSFNAELALGHFPQIARGDTEAMHQEFLRFFNARIRVQPEITALVNDINARAERQMAEATSKVALETQERERLKKQGVEEYLRSVADSRQAAPPHPLGSLTAATVRDSASAGSVVAAPVAATPSNPDVSARDQALDSARERARRLGLQQGR